MNCVPRGGTPSNAEEWYGRVCHVSYSATWSAATRVASGSMPGQAGDASRTESNHLGPIEVIGSLLQPGVLGLRRQEWHPPYVPHFPHPGNTTPLHHYPGPGIEMLMPGGRLCRVGRGNDGVVGLGWDGDPA